MPKSKQKARKGIITRLAVISREIINDNDRTARTVLATENPARVYDWERGIVNEILLVKGANFPDQIPLLDSHNRWTTDDIRGSMRDIRIENGELVTETHFSETAEKDWTLVKEGHLTDVSVGYRVYADETLVIDVGETGVIDGKEYNNDTDLPLLLRKKWDVLEGSLVAIGADQAAKFRELMDNEDENSNNHTQVGGKNMPDDIKKTENGDESKEVTKLRASIEAEKEEARKQGILDEQQRCADIRETLAIANLNEEKRADLEKELIGDGSDLTKARKAIAEAVRASLDSGNVDNLHIKADATDKFHRAAVDTLLVRAGSATSEQLENVRKAGLSASIQGITRECLSHKNPGAGEKYWRKSAEELYHDAVGEFSRSVNMTSGSLPSILLDAMNKMIGTSFDSFDPTWAQWCGVGSVSDFKDIHMISRGSFSDVQEIKDGEGPKLGKFDDKQETASLNTYGNGVNISRKTFINDDMGALSDMMSMLGAAHARGVEDLVYSTFVGTSLAGPTMTEPDSDGSTRTFFSSTAGTSSAAEVNLLATSGVLSESTLATARKTLRKLGMLTAKDKGVSRTRWTGLEPRYVLTGVDKEEEIMRYFASPALIMNTVADDLVPLSTAKRNLIPIFSPALQYYLTAQSKADAWYVIADKNSGYQACRVYFLNGNQRPILRKKENSVGEALGMSFDGYFDYGIATPEWRAAVCNDGATS